MLVAQAKKAVEDLWSDLRNEPSAKEVEIDVAVAWLGNELVDECGLFLNPAYNAWREKYCGGRLERNRRQRVHFVERTSRPSGQAAVRRCNRSHMHNGSARPKALLFAAPIRRVHEEILCLRPQPMTEDGVHN